ncbi:ferredoxin [Nocardia alni]|uniref:ferredoxin n=1 Tax=Nocardia alni TaxID=2815723 RepID=UPI0027E1C4A2|nr:ferredoxin [Nocardia alni]
MDRERCIDAGMCVLTAPGAFDQDTEDGRAALLDRTAEPGAVREAVRPCPPGAITIVDQSLT